MSKSLTKSLDKLSLDKLLGTIRLATLANRKYLKPAIASKNAPKMQR